ncbi:alkaline ceramidase ydc1 [Savitreella phatthalungensis]
MMNDSARSPVLGFPYRPSDPRDYFWGPVTATIDWCEENYVVTRYIAEFCNTTTNSLFMILGVIAIYNAVRWRYERRILLTSLGYLLVGIGSWLFHMTLKYEYQLLDELPMIYTTLIMFWGIFEGEFKRKLHSVLLGVATVALGVAITWYYLVDKNPVFHEIAYGLITVSVLGRSWYLVWKRVEEPRARRDLSYAATVGGALFLAGFGLWRIDQVACSSLRHARHVLGIPIGFLLEFHGWWHVLTSAGVAFYITFLAHLRAYLTGRQDEFQLRYVANVWPYLARTDGYKSVPDDHEA